MKKTHSDLSFLRAGIICLQENETQAAIIAFQEAFKHNESKEQALDYLANIYLQEKPQEGISFFLNQIEKQTNPKVHFHLGELYQKIENLPLAVEHYQTSLKLERSYAPSYLSLGKLFFKQKQFEFALAYFTEAFEYHPNHSEIQFFLALTHQSLENFEEALNVFKVVLRKTPKESNIHHNMGLCYLALKRSHKAFISFEQALSLDPNLDYTYNGLGEHFLRQQKWLYASGCFKLVLRGQHFTKTLIYLKLGFCHEQESQTLQAHYFYEKALKNQPQNPLYKYLFHTLYPRLVLKPPQERLDSLTHYYSQEKNAQGIFPAFSKENKKFFMVPYYASIHAENPATLMKEVGDYFKGQTPFKKRVKRKKGPKKIGVISSFLYNHSVLRLFLPLLEALSQSEHTLLSFYLTPDHRDEYTERISQISELIPLTSLKIEELTETLRAHELDIAIFPELGMDSLSYFLAAERVASQQYVLPGHPVTSGLDTVDYFISAKDVEPKNAHKNYKEKLILLPHLPVYYSPIQEVSPIPFKEPTLVFPHGLYKWDPRFESVLLSILEECPFQLIAFKGLHHHFHQQIQLHLEKNKSPLLNHIQFKDYMDYSDYLSVLKGADITLDSLVTNGFHTTYESLAMGTPVISLEGETLKQRISASVLKTLDLTEECIAKTSKEYSQKVSSLLKNPHQIQEIQKKIQKNKHLIFEQSDRVTAFIKLFEHSSSTKGI